jgi:cytochrome P450
VHLIQYVKYHGLSLLHEKSNPQTVSAIYACFLAMVLFPEVARKAQEEIDSVVGQDRLPGFEDRPYLPYVNALVKELYRWHNVAPLGVSMIWISK